MVVTGDTLIVLVVAEVLHEYVVAPLAVKMADDPGQMAVEVTVKLGSGVTLTVEVFAVLQPNEVPVTV